MTLTLILLSGALSALMLHTMRVVRHDGPRATAPPASHVVDDRFGPPGARS